MNIYRLSLVVALALGLGTLEEAGAQVMMERAVVATGGSRTSSATTVATLTLGQPVAGRTQGAGIAGEFGFWSSALVTSSVPGSPAGPIAACAVTPNPVRTKATIDVKLAAGGVVDVLLYNSDGRQERTLYSGRREAGSFRVTFDPAGLASGTYFVVVSMPGGLLQQPVTVVH